MRLLILVISGLVRAADLMPPFVLESTTVLPNGVRSPRLLSFTISPSERFTGAGETVPLGQGLNRPVSWNDVLSARTDEVDRTVLRGILLDNRIPLDGLAGITTGIIQTQVHAFVPVLTWGITRSLTLVFLAPYIRADTRVAKGFVSTQDGQRFVEAICTYSPQKCAEAADRLNNAIDSKLERLGYEPLRSESFQGWGDLQTQAKYQWFESEASALSFKLGVTLPTGRTANPDRALDIATGDGRVKTMLTSVYSRRWSNLKGTVHLGYGLLMPHDAIKRLPTSDDDSLSIDRVELTRQLGEQAVLGGGLEYSLAPLGLTLSTALTGQYQSKSRWRPSEGVDSQRVNLLENLEPSQRLLALSAGAGFSTVSWYRLNQFALPLQLNVLWSRPIAGRNVPNSEVISGEMVLFF